MAIFEMAWLDIQPL